MKNISIRSFLDKLPRDATLGVPNTPITFKVDSFSSGTAMGSFLNNDNLSFTIANFSWISDFGSPLFDKPLLLYPSVSFSTLVSNESYVNLTSGGDLFFDPDKFYRVTQEEEYLQMTYKPIKTININSQIDSVADFKPEFKDF